MTVLTAFDFGARKTSGRKSKRRPAAKPALVLSAPFVLGDPIPPFQLLEHKRITGYPFTTKDGEQSFGRFKFKCFRFTIVHKHAKPGQHCCLLFSDNNGFEKWTWTNSMGIKREMTKRQFHSEMPKRLGSDLYADICTIVYK